MSRESIKEQVRQLVLEMRGDESTRTSDEIAEQILLFSDMKEITIRTDERIQTLKEVAEWLEKRHYSDIAEVITLEIINQLKRGKLP